MTISYSRRKHLVAALSFGDSKANADIIGVRRIHEGVGAHQRLLRPS